MKCFVLCVGVHKMNGLWRHVASGKLYNVIGVARTVENPNVRMVVYRQRYASILRGTNVELPIGTLWVRDQKDFIKKFSHLKNNGKNK